MGHGLKLFVKQTLHEWFPSIPGPTEGDYIGSCKKCFKPGHHCNGICPGNAYYAPGQPGNLDGKMPRVELPKNYKLPPEFTGWTTPNTYTLDWHPVNYGPEQWYYLYGDNRYGDQGGPYNGHEAFPGADYPRLLRTGSRRSGRSAVSSDAGSRRSCRERPSYRDREERGAGLGGGGGYGSIRGGGIGGG